MKKVEGMKKIEGLETPQQIFDYVLQKLRQQGRASVGIKACMLRGYDGTSKCAVGWLIPDVAYDLRLEMYPTLTVSKVAKTYGVDKKLLFDMQVAHDFRMPKMEGESLEHWEAQMAEVARTNSLEYKAP